MDSPTQVNEEEPQVGGKRLKSMVWQHFKKIKVGELNKAECNYCKKLLGGESKNGTRHLHDHNKVCKMRPFNNIRQKTLVQQQWKADGKMSISNYTFDQESSRKDLASMIIMHEYPISMVEHYGFKKYSTNLQPLFKIPSRNTIRSDIMKIYDTEKSKIMDLLKKNSSRVAITTDMWTASNQKKGFMAITAHFIDNNWNLQSLVLRFLYVPCPHTSAVLSKELLKCIFDWNIERKLSTLTVDNCSTNDAIVDILVSKLNPSHLLLRGKLIHMRCCAHILNLIVQDGLKVMGDGIERVRDSVAFWTATPKRQQTFKENVQLLNINYSKQLMLDCKTRWNSTYLMLSVALEYKDVFYRLEQRDPLFISSPTDEDWVLAEEICKKLLVFYNASNAFSGRKYPTSNVFFPLMCEIKLSLSTWAKSSIETIRNMATSMSTKFDKYWEKVHGIMGVATVLDPRYKLKLLEYFFPHLYGHLADYEMQRITNYCYDLLHEYEISTQTQTWQSSCNSPKVNDVDVSSFLDGFDSFVNDSNKDILKSELDHYLEEKVLPRTPDFDILAWWKSCGLRYPILQMIAKDILAIPISTVASESAFSTGGRLVSPHRSRLHADTLEALMCAQNWLMKDIEGECSKKEDACGTINEDFESEEEELE
ncbi:hypothetical protein J5N97_009889 [Dioscorea zingiberensis]|uniref:BED-type domain-containing protein n=1 Tax=Dioscorea zingiberensis TaxID=325984 RepID=A0A9D5HM33_9LILI|nr:hypothetical protein J5N97_009889 [Dioscorea zingiberensis]